MVGRSWVAVAVVAAPTGPLVGQVTNPGHHFGASSIPARGTDAYLGVSLDRFTPNGKPNDPGVYNAIERTMGFNFVGYTFASTSRRWPGTIYRGTAQLGWGHDQPTEWLQNTLHRLAGKLPVASVDPRNGALDAALTGEVVRWFSAGGSAELFAGAAASVGTPYSEGWIQGGGVLRGRGRRPTVSAMVKVGVPFRGGAFPDSTLAARYRMVEVAAELPLSAWLGASWLPSFFVSFVHDTGLFTDLAGSPIGERHGSFGLVARDGSWRFEAWNEYFGGRFTDKGPTGGGRLSFRVPRIRLLDRLP